MLAEQSADHQFDWESTGEWTAALHDLAGWGPLWRAVHAVGEITAAGYQQRRQWYFCVSQLPEAAGGLHIVSVWGMAWKQHLCAVGYGPNVFVAYREALRWLRAHVTQRTFIPF